LLRVADLRLEQVVAGSRRLSDDRDVALREGVQQIDAHQPVGIAIEQPAADANRRDARNVRAVRKRRAHHVELVFDAPPPVPDFCQVPLALELAATEDRVALRIESLFQVARAGWTANRGIAVAEIAGQAPEDEAAKSRVIGRDLEAERRDRTSQ